MRLQEEEKQTIWVYLPCLTYDVSLVEFIIVPHRMYLHTLTQLGDITL
jgi:hypothetical protein